MSGPEKPFSCVKSGCGESFTNEDRLAVHAKKHDMELQLGPKGEVFVADQTPTPTRFIRNCEEVGLFQDLQNVNPFEETFKRAIESRTGTHNLNLDTLTVANPDDTLHTPHIFPNLPEDNGTVIYSTNTDADRPSLGVRLSSSSSNQLSVVRCLTSSIDDGLPQININNKSKCLNSNVSNIEEIKTVHKSYSTSKVKLRRQESIDLPDEISDVPILNNLMNVEHHNNDVHQVETIRESTSQFKNPQIPIISISEIPKSDQHDKEKKEFYMSNYHSSLSGAKEREPEQKTYLNVSTCIKNNYTKLISQKSIEMALANFTNEAQTKLVDLNNISIEDIPETSSILRENSKGENSGEGNQLPDNQPRQLIFIQNKPTDVKSSDKESTTDTSHCSTPSHSPNNSNNNVPVIEINDSVASVNTQKGYELILKWPDGKQIYLKEINKDSETQNLDSPSKPAHDNTHNVNKSVINHNVKRKLKDMIAINGKKMQTESTCNTINNQVVFNPLPMQNVVVPAKYIFVPMNDPKLSLPVPTNDCNLVPGPIKESPLHPKELPNASTIAQPVIRTVLNGKICEGTKALLPVITSVRKINSNKNVRRHVITKDTRNAPSAVSPDEDPLEIKKRGNRAAVLRYRLRGKQKQKNLIEKNEMLEKKNKELSDLLKLAYAEINYLRKKIGVNQNSSNSHVEPSSHRPMIAKEEPSGNHLKVIKENGHKDPPSSLPMDKPSVIL